MSNDPSTMAAEERFHGQGAAGPLIPATACSNSGEGPFTFLNIGKTFQRWPTNDRNQAGHWFVAVDLTTQLNVVASVFSTNSGVVPPEIKRLEGDPRYFLFVLGNQLRGHLIPTGELYTFLRNVGSGRQLATLEQLATHSGTGTIMRYTYLLAATMTVGDLPGFEAFSDVHHVFLTMQFMPVKLSDKIVYAPVQHF